MVLANHIDTLCVRKDRVNCNMLSTNTHIYAREGRSAVKHFLKSNFVAKSLKTSEKHERN